MDVGPFMFLESALYGVPCITTRHGHAALIIKHGINGWFIEPTQDSLRGVISEILGNVESIEMARSNIRRDFTTRFNKDSGRQEWDLFFQYLLNESDK
mgnify:CR=1 FL=1